MEQVLLSLKHNIISPLLKGLHSQEFIQIPLEIYIEAVTDVRKAYEAQGSGPALYSFFEEVLTNYVTENVITPLSSKSVDNILGPFLNYWETYKHLVY